MLANWFGRGNAPVSSSTHLPTKAELDPGSTTDGRRPLVLHPFLIGSFPILYLYRQNLHELPPSVLIGPVGLTIGTTALIWLGLRLGTRDSLRSGLVTSMAVVLFFAYESIRGVVDNAWNFLNSFWVYRERHVHSLVFMSLVGLLMIVGFRVIFRWVARPGLWNANLNIFASILVALPTLGILSSKFVEPSNSHQSRGLPTLKQQGSTPDIYFIILDGYARADVMKEIYGFDNQPFLDRLAGRGFFVAKQSMSNYCQTQISLASTLNADYIDQFLDQQTRDLTPVQDRLKNNLVRDLLHPRGYKYVTFSSGFWPTEVTNADIYLTSGPSPSVFNQILIAMTPLAPLSATILPSARWNDQYSMSRDRTNFILDQLPSVTKIPGPTFTFAHILSPHPPFLFGENGEDVSPRSTIPGQTMVPKPEPYYSTPTYVREGYRQQAIYLTKRIERVIDQILDQSPEPPIIILQSDHGAWLHYHHNDVEATDLRERFGTLNAIYIPGPKAKGLADNMESVNTFRIVMNHAFGSNLPLLEGRNYFSTLLDPLTFIDVTKRLHSEQERTRTFRSPDKFIGLLQQF